MKKCFILFTKSSTDGLNFIRVYTEKDQQQLNSDHALMKNMETEDLKVCVEECPVFGNVRAGSVKSSLPVTNKKGAASTPARRAAPVPEFS